MKKRILIIGVNGFIGRSLWKFLSKRKEFLLFGLDLKMDHKKNNFFLCDVMNKKQLQVILAKVKPDYIFQLAGGRLDKKNKMISANIETTKQILNSIQTILGRNVRVVIPGSAAEYGDMPKGKRKIDEAIKERPVGDYGVIKLKQTRIALTYVKKGLDIVVARMFNIIGEDTPSVLCAGRFAEQIAMIESNKMVGVLETNNLSGRRDFLDIEDICRGLLDVAIYGKRGEIYNVCSSRSVSIRTLLYKLLKLSKNKKLRACEDKSSSSGTFNMIGSNQKLFQLNRWKPKVSLERGLKNTLDSFRKKY